MKLFCCNTCKQDFEPIPYLEETEQAHGCSATVYLYEGDFYILGHYGSTHDMRRYSLDPCPHYELGNICDTCINSLVSEGVAKLIEDGVW